VGHIARSGQANGVILFFALTYALAWFCWSLATGWWRGTPTAPAGPIYLLFLLGVFAPSIIALLLTARSEGRAGIEVLLRRLARVNVGIRWYLFAVGYFAIVKLVVAFLYRAGFGEWPRFGGESVAIIIGAIVLSTPFQAGEEIGWRGYALPRLASRMGLGRASVLLGIVWACWHLPLFYVAGADTSGQSFPVYLVQVTAVSVAMAWLFGNANGSVLLTMIMHSAVNQTKDIVPSAVPGATRTFALSSSRVAWLTVALLWACAVYFLRRMPSLDADRR
jgi:membrane protease YdiL (CAAX protease family)